jgi:hypothetical protein
MSILIGLFANYLINCLKGFLGAETREHVAYGQVLYIDHTWTSPEALLYRRDCSRSGTKTYIGRSRIVAGFMHMRYAKLCLPTVLYRPTSTWQGVQTWYVHYFQARKANYFIEVRHGNCKAFTRKSQKKGSVYEEATATVVVYCSGLSATAQEDVTPTIILRIFFYLSGKTSRSINIRVTVNWGISTIQSSKYNTNSLFALSLPTPCCSSLDPTTKDGTLGSPANLGNPTTSLPRWGPS